MTKTNKIRSAVVAIALACGVGLPLVSAAANGCFDKPAPLAFETEAHAGAAPERVVTLPDQVLLPEVVVVGHAGPAREKARPAPKKAHAKPACRFHALEQGGSPSAPFVLACG